MTLYLLLTLIMIMTALLIWLGTLHTLFGMLLIGGSAVALVILIRQQLGEQRQLKTRCTELKARWGLVARHLTGLPLPVDTPLFFFYTGEGLVLDAGQDLWNIERSHVLHLLLTTAEQIRRINDQQLHTWVRTSSNRMFFALREKIRHHDRSIRHASILFLTYMPLPGEQQVLVLVVPGKPQRLAAMLQASGLRDQVVIKLQEHSDRTAAASVRTSR